MYVISIQLRSNSLNHHLFEKELLTPFVESYLLAGVTSCCDFFSCVNLPEWTGTGLNTGTDPYLDET